MKKEYLSNEDIKCELVKMLEELDAFFYKNSLKYSIVGGTMLGSVRHGGFIPWDDDIDVALLRTDYEKLIKLLKDDNNLGNDNLIIKGYEIGNSDLPFLKLINKKIYATERYGNDIYTDTNLWIDILPLDSVPNKYKSIYFFILHSILRRLYTYKREEKNGWVYRKSVFKSIILKILKLFSYSKLIEIYIRACSMFSIEKNNYISGNVCGIGKLECFPKEYMDEISTYKFENILVKGMKNSHQWLSIRYGEYMKIPKDNEIQNHGIMAWRIIDDEK